MQVLHLVLIGALLSRSWAVEEPEYLTKSSRMLRAQNVDPSRSAPRFEVGPMEAVPDELNPESEEGSGVVIEEMEPVGKGAVNSDIANVDTNKKAAKAKSVNKAKDRSRKLLRSEPRLEVGPREAVLDDLNSDCTAPTSLKADEADSKVPSDTETKKTEKNKNASANSESLKVGPGTNAGPGSESDAKVKPKQKSMDSSLDSPAPAKEA